MEANKIYHGDCIEVMKGFPDACVDMCMTSPPYWGMRDYGINNQLGLESSYQQYINDLCGVFDEVKRVLKPKGTCWVVIGDTYNANYRGGGIDNLSDKQASNKGSQDFVNKKGKSNKCLLQIPNRFSIKMINRGWILRNEIIWHKPACMPENVKDRFTMDFEKVFFFVKNKDYDFRQQFEPIKLKSIKRSRRGNNKNKYSVGDYIPGNADPQTLNKPKEHEGYKGIWKELYNKKGRNMRAVWSVNTSCFKGDHKAVYPKELCKIPVKAGCPKGGIVLDPFVGSGTTCVVAKRNRRKYVGIDLNKKNVEMARKRVNATPVYDDLTRYMDDD